MTNDKQQTTVEWIEQEMLKGNLSLKEILEQAKEVEKERIIKANRDGVDMVVDKKDFISGEQYYNKTYGEK
jgi:hypothetical protein